MIRLFQLINFSTISLLPLGITWEEAFTEHVAHVPLQNCSIYSLLLALEDEPTFNIQDFKVCFQSRSCFFALSENKTRVV